MHTACLHHIYSRQTKTKKTLTVLYLLALPINHKCHTNTESYLPPSTTSFKKSSVVGGPGFIAEVAGLFVAGNRWGNYLGAGLEVDLVASWKVGAC